MVMENSDNISTIVSVCAILVSVVSLIVTFYFSHLQMVHNKNSVRPISFINLCDYEDCISVSIVNVGTGPLKIHKLSILGGEVETSNLVSLLPNVPQKWSTYDDDVNGRTIPVNGTITLVEINPKTRRTRRMIRKKLSTLTINLEYEDIYSTKFFDKKDLTFFSRLL